MPSLSSCSERRFAPCFGTGEDQHLLELPGLDDVGQQGPLALAVHGMDDLADQLGGGVGGCDLHGGGGPQELRGQLLDLVREGGREEQGLPFRGQQREDLLDVADEPHVEHAVGLVQHQDLQLAEVQVALALMVQQAARRGDEDLDAGPEGLGLGVDVHAAEDGGGAQRDVLAIGADALLYLHGQLAGGREDEGPDGVARGGGRSAGVGRQQLQHGQGEAGGLAGAGLGAAHEVAAFQHQGNGLDLDGGGVFVALLAYGAQELGQQPEGFEGHGRS